MFMTYLWIITIIKLNLYTYDNANRLWAAGNGDSSYCSGLPCSYDVNYVVVTDTEDSNFRMEFQLQEMLGQLKMEIQLLPV